MAFGALGAIGLLTFRGIASPMMAALFAKPLFSMQMQLVVFPFILYCILSGKDFFMLDQQVYSILFLWVILNIETNPDSIIRLESGVMRWLGKISYGLYCFNWITIVGAIIIVRSVFHRADAPVAQMCMQWLAVALTVAAAQLSYWLLERPFLRLKHYISPIEVGERNNEIQKAS
jgi:peptidoglycan/LPS O-acetylase OafA/YrhL